MESFQTKDPQLIKYLEKGVYQSGRLDSFKLMHILREQYMQTDLLAKLTSTKKLDNNLSIIQQTLAQPNIDGINHLLPNSECHAKKRR